jgi:hypothetical protein
MPLTTRYAACACGKVRCRLLGEPILSAVCYCDDCQKGAEPIEALPGATAFREADGGTPYLTWRDDRFACVEGADLLTDYKLTDRAPTRRTVASCCNSAMFLKFGPGHWVSAYRMRFEGDPPPLEMRTQTRFRRSNTPLPDDVRGYPGFPAALFARLIGARLAMFLWR